MFFEVQRIAFRTSTQFQSSATHQNADFSLYFWFSINAIWFLQKNDPSTFFGVPTSFSCVFPSARFASPDLSASLLLGRWCCFPTRATFAIRAVPLCRPSAFVRHTTEWCRLAVRSLCRSLCPFSYHLSIQS